MRVHVWVLVWESHMLQNGSPEGVRDCLRQSVRTGRRGNARNGAAFRGNDGEWMRGETMRWRWGRQFWDKIEGSRVVTAWHVTQGRWNLTYSGYRALLPPPVPLCRREHPSQPFFCRVVLTASVQCWLFPFSPWRGGGRQRNRKSASLSPCPWLKQAAHQSSWHSLSSPFSLHSAREWGEAFFVKGTRNRFQHTHTHTHSSV